MYVFFLLLLFLFFSFFRDPGLHHGRCTSTRGYEIITSASTSTAGRSPSMRPPLLTLTLTLTLIGHRSAPLRPPLQLTQGLLHLYLLKLDAHVAGPSEAPRKRLREVPKRCLSRHRKCRWVVGDGSCYSCRQLHVPLVLSLATRRTRARRRGAG